MLWGLKTTPEYSKTMFTLGCYPMPSKRAWTKWSGHVHVFWLLVFVALCLMHKAKEQTCKTSPETLLGAGAWQKAETMKSRVCKRLRWEASSQPRLTPTLFVKQTSLRKPGCWLTKQLSSQHQESDLWLIRLPSWRGVGHRAHPS